MGAFKSWLKQNHAAYCVYCGYDVDQEGNKGETLLHPRDLHGEQLRKHIAQYDLTNLHPVVCKECWMRENKGKGVYPGRSNKSTSNQKSNPRDVLSTAVTKTYVPELSKSDLKRAG